jgi:hypothetical protein
MKRVTVCVLVLVLALVFSGFAFAAEKKSEKKPEQKPDATLKLSEGQVALGIGWSWGKGVLKFKGKEYPFKVEGLSVGDVGITKAEAEGKVYNLKKLSDFSANYVAATAAATLAVGAGATALQSDKNVVIHLFPKTKGINLKLAGEGVKFRLEEKKK